MSFFDDIGDWVSDTWSNWFPTDFQAEMRALDLPMPPEQIDYSGNLLDESGNIAFVNDGLGNLSFPDGSNYEDYWTGEDGSQGGVDNSVYRTSSGASGGGTGGGSSGSGSSPLSQLAKAAVGAAATTMNARNGITGSQVGAARNAANTILGGGSSGGANIANPQAPRTKLSPIEAAKVSQGTDPMAIWTQLWMNGRR